MLDSDSSSDALSDASRANLRAKLKDLFSPLFERDEHKGTLFLYPRNDVTDWDAATRSLSADLVNVSGLTTHSAIPNKRQKRFAVSISFPTNPVEIYRRLESKYSIRFSHDSPICVVRCRAFGTHPNDITETMANECGKLIGGDLFLGVVKDLSRGMFGGVYSMFFKKWPLRFADLDNLKIKWDSRRAISFLPTKMVCNECQLRGHSKTTCWKKTCTSAEQFHEFRTRIAKYAPSLVVSPNNSGNSSKKKPSPANNKKKVPTKRVSPPSNKTSRPANSVSAQSPSPANKTPQKEKEKVESTQAQPVSSLDPSSRESPHQDDSRNNRRYRSLSNGASPTTTAFAVPKKTSDNSTHSAATVTTNRTSALVESLGAYLTSVRTSAENANDQPATPSEVPVAALSSASAESSPAISTSSDPTDFSTRPTADLSRRGVSDRSKRKRRTELEILKAAGEHHSKVIDAELERRGKMAYHSDDDGVEGVDGDECY